MMHQSDIWYFVNFSSDFDDVDSDTTQLPAPNKAHAGHMTTEIKTLDRCQLKSDWVFLPAQPACL